jgi:hypothetical protein
MGRQVAQGGAGVATRKFHLRSQQPGLALRHGIALHGLLQAGKQLARQRNIAQMAGCQRRCIQGRCPAGRRQFSKATALGLGHPLAQHVGAGARLHARTRCHQRMLQRGLRLCAPGGQARLHVGLALRGQRVAAQVGPGAVVIEPVGLLEFVEHGDKTLGRKACAVHQTKAHAVGFALHVARKVELVLHRQRLPAHRQGLRSFGVLARRQHRQNHAAQQQRRLLALLRHQAGDVALRDVAEFVRQHRGQLVTAGSHANQAQVHAQVAPRQSKGIDAAVAAQQYLPGKALVQLGRHLTLRPCRRQQGLPLGLHALHEHRGRPGSRGSR